MSGVSSRLGGGATDEGLVIGGAAVGRGPKVMLRPQWSCSSKQSYQCTNESRGRQIKMRIRKKFGFGLVVAALAALAVSVSVASATTPSYYDPSDPQTTNIPYLAWIGEQVRVEKCVITWDHQLNGRAGERHPATLKHQLPGSVHRRGLDGRQRSQRRPEVAQRHGWPERQLRCTARGQQAAASAGRLI